MPKHIINALIFLLVVWSFSTLASSSIIDAELAETSFREAYEDKLNVSTGVIVGLTLGVSSGIGSINEVVLDKSGLSGSEIACMRITSVDGLFWAENAFRIPGNESLWRIKPISKNFKDKVKTYGQTGMVGTVILSETTDNSACTTQTPVLTPIIANLSANNQLLVTYINSSGRFTEAELHPVKQDSLLATGTCQSVEHQTAAVYDQVCIFDLTDKQPSGLLEIRLFFDAPPFGVETWNETIALPIS